MRSELSLLHRRNRNAVMLFTFGYEGLSIDPFVKRLTQVGVRAVLDVRQRPLSRKRGFSKNALNEALREADISYVHLPELGCPQPIRERYKADADWSRYAEAFGAYLATQDDALMQVGRIAQKTDACLVCFEADFNRCHRSIVARATARAGGPRVTHLTIKEEIPDATVHLAA